MNSFEKTLVAAENQAQSAQTARMTGEWTCNQCTFINPDNVQVCAMCYTTKEDEEFTPLDIYKYSDMSYQTFPDYSDRGGIEMKEMKAAMPQIDAGTHRRMTTEEQLSLAIDTHDNNEDEENMSNKHAHERTETIVDHMMPSPESSSSPDHTSRQRHDREEAFIAKEKDINLLKVKLNLERKTCEELRYQNEELLYVSKSYEQTIEKLRKELEVTKAKLKDAEVRCKELEIFCAQKIKDRPNVESKDGNDREPTYGGIYQLFQNTDGAKPTALAISAPTNLDVQAHSRKPSYVGLSGFFDQGSEVTQNTEAPRKGLEQESKETESSTAYDGLANTFEKADGQKTSAIIAKHSAKPSFWGTYDLFRDDVDITSGDTSTQVADTYEGIYDLFAADGLIVNNPAEHERNATFSGVPNMFGALELTSELFTHDKKVESTTEGGFEKHDGAATGMQNNKERDLVKEESSLDDSKQTVNESGLGQEAENQTANDADAQKEDLPDFVEELIEADFDVLWQHMLEKVHHPEKYLPVEDVGLEPRDGKGKWVRHMFLFSLEIVVTEEIYIDEWKHQITFVDHNYPLLEIIHTLEKTTDPKHNRVVLYKQNRDTKERQMNKELMKVFRSELHFLKVRAAQKMKNQPHARAPSYGGISSLIAKPSQQVELFTRAAPKKHKREFSMSSIRTTFNEQDPPGRMAQIQEEVYRVMDTLEWTELTKGVVSKEVEEALGFPLKPHHERFVKITMMRVVDGKLELECFGNKGQIKQESIEDAVGRVFEEQKKIKQEKDTAKQMKRHTRNVSYGAVIPRDVIADEGPEVEPVTSDRAVSEIIKLAKKGGFVRINSDNLENLYNEVNVLRQLNIDLRALNTSIVNSKIELVVNTSQEIERLRAVCSRSVEGLLKFPQQRRSDYSFRNEANS
jgi:hypothetical protein